MKLMTPLRKKIATASLSALFLACGISSAHAQSVLFPQETQPGIAVMQAESDVWTLANDILSASFVRENGHLFFGGCKALNLEKGSELFEVRFGSTGTKTVKASEMTLQKVEAKTLEGDTNAVKGSERFPGQALEATFTYKYSTATVTILWRAVLRDGSHYIRTEMEVTSDKAVQFYNLTPMIYTVNASEAGSTPRVVGNTRGAIVISDKIFAGLETPMGINSAGSGSVATEGEIVQTVKDSWTQNSFTVVPENEVPKRVNEVGYYYPDVSVMKKQITLNEKGALNVEIVYADGTHGLNIVGVDIVNENGDEVSGDYHHGFSGYEKKDNLYSFSVPYAGTFTIRYFVETKTETITSSGNITANLVVTPEGEVSQESLVPVTGVWSRNTKLQSNDNWKVSAVVGLVAEGQQRRSFLAYSERERAVPWRAYPCYISWYELNIDRNNATAPGYVGNMTIEQCADVVSHWKSDFYEKYHIAPKAFVWDDGWDNYGTWTFNCNFPNGFREVDDLAKDMNTGIGAWLGPVGGYGKSGDYRRAYWTNQGQKMELSNANYYQVFKDAAKNLTVDQGYDFRFFKFDGISDKFSATGPADGVTGEENAEGIIRLERYVREDLRPDIFFNTTVGTWASPFWYHFSDATWRQEKDYGTVGNNSIDRENWITYRDELVYRNYVTASPICPINTLMTHGFILSSHGDVSKNMDYEAVVREMRCAFACGSGMVELYNDYALMNSINGGRLWGDLAECIQWQQENADVLPDAHWVGGNPWDGSKANIYGWASWNGEKATLALRNGATTTKTFTTTLREALEIPAYVKGTIQLRKAFGNQAALSGLDENTPIDIDTKLSLKLPASSLYVFSGAEGSAQPVAVTGISLDATFYKIDEKTIFTPVATLAPANAWNKTITWATSDKSIATVDAKTGVVTAKGVGTCMITATAADGNHVATATINVSEYVKPDYYTSFDKDDAASRSDRYLNGVSITVKGVKQTATADASHKPYQLLEDIFEVEPGATIQPAVDWNGTWMHSYVYVDYDRNRQFDVESANDEELVSYTYYNGKNSKGTSVSNSCGVGSLPSFVAPQEPGEYMMRFKVDWDCIDPAGNSDPSNLILTNGGSITDVVLRVKGDSDGISTVSSILHPNQTFDLQGRPVTDTSAHGVYIINGKKVVK